MTVARNVKLGLFVIAAFVAAAVVAIVLGLHAMRPATIRYHAYFDESVQGLDLGSPVKYRGVRIGSVEGIEVAPDRKHVDVSLALIARDAHRLGLAEGPPELRAQLTVQGLTGLCFVELDFFDPTRYPPQLLPFPAAERTIPTQQSVIHGLASDLETISKQLPKLADRASATFDRFDRVLDDIHDEQLVARIGDALDRTGAAASELRRLAGHVDRARLPEQTEAVLASADRAIADLRRVIARVDGDHGLVASTQRATDSIGELGRTLASSDELSHALREVADAARAMRELAEQIDHEPDMLVKGRARSGKL